MSHLTTNNRQQPRSEEVPGKPGDLLGPKLLAIIFCKLIIVFVLWACFFSPAKRMEQTPENIARGLLERDGSQTGSTQHHPQAAAQNTHSSPYRTTASTPAQEPTP